MTDIEDRLRADGTAWREEIKGDPDPLPLRETGRRAGWVRRRGLVPLAAAAAVIGVVVGTGVILNAYQGSQPSAGPAPQPGTGPTTAPASSARIVVVTAPGYPSQESLPAKVQVGSRRVETALRCGGEGRMNLDWDSRGWATLRRVTRALRPMPPGTDDVITVRLSKQDAVALAFGGDGTLSEQTTIRSFSGAWFPQTSTSCAE